MIKFPKNFYWGSATSGPQTEGSENRAETIWDYDFKKNKKAFFEQKNVQGNSYKRYEEYAEWAFKGNFNSLRTSIQWSRLLPDGENVSEDAIKFYRKYFSSFKKKNIKVFVCLFHFDMPIIFMKMGGWTSREVVSRFVNYAKKAFELFDELVDKWFTFNEAIVPVECQYLLKYHYPYEVNMKKALQSLWNIQITHHLVVQEYKKLKTEKEIGIILNITPAIARSNNKEDQKAAFWASIFQYKALLDSIVYGKYPIELIDFAKKNNLMWKIEEKDWEIMKGIKLDILGINYYQPIRVKRLESQKPSKDFVPDKYFYEHYDMPDKIINIHRGWEIYPKGLYDSLMLIKNDYKNLKTFVAENGMGVANEEKFKINNIIQDDYRINFIKKHLFWLKKALDNKVNCQGYHMWTYIDNWSWLNAYKNRYGMLELNLETNKITPKKSFLFFSKLFKENKMED